MAPRTGYDAGVALRVRVCELGQIVEGELRAFQVTGVTWPIMMTAIDGELFAFQGVCPHDDVSLAEYGALEACEVVCRVHGYHFDLRSGRCEHVPGLHLRRYRITLAGTEVWVDLL
jgi:nitrite reductase/ring-hydroxylating ferredoxin subunit